MAFGLGVPCGACGCGGSNACSCPGWSTPPYNPCCSTQCLPCSLTIGLIPGSSFSGIYASLLTSADRTEIISFLTQSWVTTLTYISTSSNINYGYSSPATTGVQWSVAVTIANGSGYNLWDSYFRPSVITGSAINSSGAAVPMMTTATGKQLMTATFAFVPANNSYYVGPFGLCQWCGQTSFDLTASLGAATYVLTPGIYVSDPSIPDSGFIPMSGGSARYTW